jgi:DNA-binding winged helix-turn-helix (wHTH) protein/tetratricopeptide (TPR) repeat protein
VGVAAVSTGELAFGQFRLDRANALLWRGQDRVVLAPKPFEVLCCLVARAGELVTKDELFDAVWSDLHVSESSLTVAMNALRAALGDDRQAPCYIETVTRRGYRFIAPVRSVQPSDVEQPREENTPVSDERTDQRRRWRVGRTAPLEVVDSVLQQVQAGNRQIVFVTGEAGIGKTTLVQMALERVEQRGMGVLHCGCNELFGTHEAFLPLIEALHEQCRGADGAFLLKSLRTCAPTWLAQMPGLLREDDRAAFQREVFGATRERMLREFADLMERLAEKRPWVIVLEDLHWSDFATIDALSRIARRDRKAAILVLATYRPVDVAAEGHPIRTIHQDLQIHGQCTELALDRLTRAEVEHYLALRFGSTDLAGRSVERVFARTGGQPLFVTSLVDHLIAQRTIVEVDGQWRMDSEEAISQYMPRDLREMLTRQIDQLTAEERGVLEVASAAGGDFSALLVAGAMDRDVLGVEQLCEELAQTGRIVAAAGVTEWPNGALSGSYAFQHALYQEVLYQRLAPARRVNTHRRVGESLERGYGARAPEVASVLALHFELGHDYAKAMRYLGLSAESSARRFSTREAVSYLSRALDLVSHLPAELQLPTRVKLLLQRAWAWRAGGDFARSREDLLTLVAHAAETGHLREEVNGLVDLSRFCLYVDRRQCLPFAAQALEKSLGIEDPAFRALVQGNFANLNMMLEGWRAEDADACRQAASLIGDSQDISMRLRRCSMEMVFEFLCSNYTACCDATRRGKELARLVGDVYLFTVYNTVEAFAFLYLGEWGKVRESVVSTLAIAERNVNPQASALCRYTIGFLHAEAQDFESAARHAEDALNPTIAANPFSMFLGRTLLARAYIGLGDLPRAREHLEAIERRAAADGVPVDSLIVPQHLTNQCAYWLAAKDLGQAQAAALRLHEITSAAPDLPFLALSLCTQAKVAMATGNARAAGSRLSEAISIVRHAKLPLAAWRAYTMAADLHESLGDAARAARWRHRSQRTVQALANSLQPADPLRSLAFLRSDRDAPTGASPGIPRCPEARP